MGMAPHLKCCGCCCSLHLGTAIGTALYIAFLLILGVVLPAAFAPPSGVEQAKMFCTGTTPAYRLGDDVNSYNLCHGSDICSDVDWDEVQGAAVAAGWYGWIMDLLCLLLMIGTMVLIVKKHAAGLKIAWKLLAVMPLLVFLNPILQAAVSNPAGMKMYTGNQFYVRAAKDLVCGNNLGGFAADPAHFLSIKTTDEKLENVKKGYPVLDAKYAGDKAEMCSAKNVKWVGAPDPTDDLAERWAGDVCADSPGPWQSVIPFVWYIIFYLGLLSYLIFNIWSFKEELAGAPKDDTEMGARPAVAVATAVATATPAVAVATATATATVAA